MSTKANVEATMTIFAALGAGDIDAMLAHLEDDIHIEFYGPEVIPYAGTYDGKAAARRFLETVLASVEIHEFVPEHVIAEGDKVVVNGHLTLTARATGRTFSSAFAHVITMRNARWLRFCDFMNTAVAAEAFAA